MTQSRAQMSDDLDQARMAGRGGTVIQKVGEVPLEGQQPPIRSNADTARSGAAVQADPAVATKRNKTNGPGPNRARESDIANALLNLERETRKAETEAELGYLMVNG